MKLTSLQWAIGLLGLASVFFVAHGWLTERTLTDADLTHLAGTATAVHSDRGTPWGLELAVSNQPYPFICFPGLYPGSFAPETPAQLEPGAPVIVGVPTAEMGSPRRNRAGKVFFCFVTLQIAARDALVISAYNQSVENDRRFGPWYCLLIACITIWLMRRASPQVEP